MKKVLLSLIALVAVSSADQLVNLKIEGMMCPACVKNVKGTLLSESTITINDYEGREFRVNYSEGLAVIKMRCFLVKNVMYMLQTICLTEKENNVSSQKFFDSFKLKM